jgi:hypothetical protein
LISGDHANYYQATVGKGQLITYEPLRCRDQRFIAGDFFVENDLTVPVVDPGAVENMYLLGDRGHGKAS